MRLRARAPPRLPARCREITTDAAGHEPGQHRDGDHAKRGRVATGARRARQKAVTACPPSGSPSPGRLEAARWRRMRAAAACWTARRTLTPSWRARRLVLSSCCVMNILDRGRDAGPWLGLAAALGHERGRGARPRPGHGHERRGDRAHRPAPPGQPHAARYRAPGPQRDQPVGQGGVRGRLAEGVHPLLERPQRGRLLAARRTPGQVREHPLALRVAQLTVDQGRQALPEVGSCKPARGRGGRGGP